MSWKPVEEQALHRVFYPRIPWVVTARSNGRDGGMPAAHCVPLSFTPPLIGVSIAPERYTYRLVRESGYFAVNLLDFKHVGKVNYIGDVSGRYLKDKMSKAGFTMSDGKAAPVPVIREASAVVECELNSMLETGDHDLFVGRCLAAYAVEDFASIWALKTYSPILYLGPEGGERPERKYISLGGEAERFPYSKGDAATRRKETLKAVKSVAERLAARGAPPTLREVGLHAAAELGLDSVDAQLIAEQLLREGRVKATKE